MTIEESKMMWKLEVENNKPLYSSFSKEMKRLYNKVDELINEGVITYEDFTNDVIDSITTTIVDNGKSNATPSRADQVNAMCDMLFKKYEEYKKQSIQEEIEKFQQIIQNYQMKPDYVNPNVPMRRAKEIIARLQKEYYLGYLID